MITKSSTSAERGAHFSTELVAAELTLNKVLDVLQHRGKRNRISSRVMQLEVSFLDKVLSGNGQARHLFLESPELCH